MTEDGGTKIRQTCRSIFFDLEIDTVLKIEYDEKKDETQETHTESTEESESSQTEDLEIDLGEEKGPRLQLKIEENGSEIEKEKIRKTIQEKIQSAVRRREEEMYTAIEQLFVKPEEEHESKIDELEEEEEQEVEQIDANCNSTQIYTVRQMLALSYLKSDSEKFAKVRKHLVMTSGRSEGGSVYEVKQPVPERFKFIMNKLTVDNAEELSKEILGLSAQTREVMEEAAAILHEQVIENQEFVKMYADLFDIIGRQWKCEEENTGEGSGTLVFSKKFFSMLNSQIDPVSFKWDEENENKQAKVLLEGRRQRERVSVCLQMLIELYKREHRGVKKMFIDYMKRLAAFSRYETIDIYMFILGSAGPFMYSSDEESREYLGVFISELDGMFERLKKKSLSMIEERLPMTRKNLSELIENNWVSKKRESEYVAEDFVSPNENSRKGMRR